MATSPADLPRTARRRLFEGRLSESPSTSARLVNAGSERQVVDGKGFRLADEIRSIQDQAAHHDGRMVANFPAVCGCLQKRSLMSSTGLERALDLTAYFLRGAFRSLRDAYAFLASNLHGRRR